MSRESLSESERMRSVGSRVSDSTLHAWTHQVTLPALAGRRHFLIHSKRNTREKLQTNYTHDLLSCSNQVQEAGMYYLRWEVKPGQPLPNEIKQELPRSLVYNPFSPSYLLKGSSLKFYTMLPITAVCLQKQTRCTNVQWT